MLGLRSIVHTYTHALKVKRTHARTWLLLLLLQLAYKILSINKSANQSVVDLLLVDLIVDDGAGFWGDSVEELLRD